MDSNYNIFFGTDGWRGLLDTEVNANSVAVVAQAFADYLNSNKKNNDIKTAIAFDGRRDSKKFATVISEVLSGNGITVFLSERVEPTPILSYFVKAMNLDAGIMVTASHNPAVYNGVKFKGSYGGPFFTEETQKVEALLGKNKIRVSEDKVELANLRDVYKEHIDSYINFDVIRDAKICVLVDSMSGAGQNIIQRIFEDHGIKSKSIFKIAKEDFSGRNAEPIEKNLEPLAEELKKEVYAMGLATDGDADRIGVLLEDGSWLTSQETILLLADYLVRGKGFTGNLVKTSSVTNKMKSFEDLNTKVYDVQVGFKYITEKMLEGDTAFGAEESGGYGFKNHIPERDGILSALLLTEMLAVSGHDKLSKLVADKRKEFGKLYYDRIDHEYTKENRTDILPQLVKNPLTTIAGHKVVEMQHYFSSRNIVNGLKFYLQGSSRWLLLRASETEPLIRIYAEGESEQEVKDFLKAGMELFN